jgi:hypothetical protein
MSKRIRSLVIAAAAIAALATGGAVFAQARSSAPESTPEPAQQEQSAPDDQAAETPGAEGKEVPDDDGPGGHADEPGNPNADHRFEGEE